MILHGQSKSTLNNYIRRIALISLHFNCLPGEISDDELQEYLTSLALDKNSPSRGSFKHMVYGLRYYFRLIGDNKRAINLPSLKNEAKLPVILNRDELRELFNAPALLKHRIVLTLIYSAGLRGQEAINLKLSDIDFQRKTIHIRQSKYKKDRVVPLSVFMARGLKKYIAAENPHVYLFNGKEPDGRYSIRGLSWVMRKALKKNKNQKTGQSSFPPPQLCYPPAEGRSEHCNGQRTFGPCLGSHHHGLPARGPVCRGAGTQPAGQPLQGCQMSRPKHEVAEIIERFGKRFIEKHAPNTYQLGVLGALSVCRTPALGGHKYHCDHCDSEHTVYNSCKNRHCPKCQSTKQAFWVEDRNICFRLKDYRDQGKAKTITLTGEEFLRRFCQYILPKGFVKVRYYGICSTRFRNTVLKNKDKMVIKPKEATPDRIKRILRIDSYRCPFCKKGSWWWLLLFPGSARLVLQVMLQQKRILHD